MTTASPPAANAAAASSGTRSLWPVILIHNGMATAPRTADTIVVMRLGSSSVETAPLAAWLA